MDEKKLIKIARNVCALDVSTLRRLQEKYDEESDIFDEVVSEFENWSEMIENDDALEDEQGFWKKIFNGYDPAKLESQLVTYIASGLFIKVFKMVGELITAQDKLSDLEAKLNEDLTTLTHKQLIELKKELKKEKKVMQKSEKIIPRAQEIIDAMIKKAGNLKGNKKIKDFANNATIKEGVKDVIDALEDSKNELESHKFKGNIDETVATLTKGIENIDKIIKEGTYKQEGAENQEGKDDAGNDTNNSINIEEKLNEFAGNLNLKNKIMDILSSITDDTNLKNTIQEQVKNVLISNVSALTKTGKSEDVINININLFTDDDNKDSLFGKIKSFSNQLVQALNRGDYINFYKELNKGINQPNNTFIIPVRDKLLLALNDEVSDDNKKVSDSDINGAFANYKIKDVLKDIKTKFEEIVNNYDPEALRIYKTSSLEKIARRIAESYK